MIRRVALFLLAIVVLTLVLWASQRRATRESSSGFIEADEIRVGSHLGGRVMKVHVAEGSLVEQGQLLVELEPYDIHERMAQAAAVRAEAESRWKLAAAGFRSEEIAQADARLRQRAAERDKRQRGARQQELESAQAQLTLAESEWELAQKRMERVEGMFQRQAASRAELDTATTELRVARARLDVQREALELLKEGTRSEDIVQAEALFDEAAQALKMLQAGQREEDIAAAKAAFAGASAAEQALKKQAEELRIVSPVAGIVEAIDLQPGDLVTPNAPALSIIDRSRLWVRAYIPENRMDLQLGVPVHVVVDSYPGREFAGRVSFVARQAEFTPRNVQTPEERSKQAFRIKVDLVEGIELLRPGMSADIVLPPPQPRAPLPAAEGHAATNESKTP